MKKQMRLLGMAAGLFVGLGISGGAEEANLLLNGDLEELAPRINLPRDWTFARETTSIASNAFSGKSAVRISQYYTCQITDIPDVAGKKYRLSGHFMNETTDTKVVASLGIMYVDSQDKTHAIQSPAAVSASPDWVEINYTTAALPPDAVRIIRFMIYVSGKNAKGEKAAIVMDNLKLLEAK